MLTNAACPGSGPFATSEQLRDWRPGTPPAIIPPWPSPAKEAPSIPPRRPRAFVRVKMSPLLRAKESAADLVQSACCEILTALDDFEYRGEDAFRGWLYTAVWHKVLNKERAAREQRRDARREVVADGMTGGSDGLGAIYARALTPTQEVMAKERVERLEGAFDALPEHYRDVVALSRIARLPRDEVARRMGRSEDSVRNLLHRALAELARRLQASRDREAS